MQTIEIETRCPICGERHYVEVFEKDFIAWRNGTLIQDAFPYLSANERELLISGTCAECFSIFFGNDDKDDYEDYTNWDGETGFEKFFSKLFGN